MSGTETLVWGHVGGTIGDASFQSVGSGGAIDWNGSGDTGQSASVGTQFDVNYFADIGGCGPSPDEFYDDHDDWENLEFDFRGVGGSSFDGYYDNPQTTSDLTPEEIEAFKSILDWYDGLLGSHTLHRNPGNDV